jgi:hypothetical protein
VITPYTIGLSNFKTSAGGPSATDFNINFDYKLDKSTSPSPDPATNVHKLVVEITDGLSNKYEAKFDLDKPVSTPASTTALSIGNGTLSIPITFGNNLDKGIKFINSISNSRSYSIKIYDEYKVGFRRLLATSSGNWFPTN